MDSKKIVALILIAILAVVLVVNRGMLDHISVNLVITTISASKSMVLLGTAAVGVVIGILLK